jgi:hypothetical protein
MPSLTWLPSTGSLCCNFNLRQLLNRKLWLGFVSEKSTNRIFRFANIEMCFRLKADKIPKNNIQLRTLATTCKRIFFPAGKALNYTSGSAQGSTVYRYRDENGYRLAIDANTKQTAVKLIDALLDVQGLKFDESKMSATKFTKEKPSKITVLSNRVDKPLRGRWGKLYLYQIEFKQVGTADRILVNGNGVVQV